MKSDVDVLQGTLDLLVLHILSAGPQHGWGVAQALKARSQERLVVTQGSLYPALHRLEKEGWIAAEWGVSENNRRAKYYRLSRSGRQQLARATERWRRYTAGVDLVLSSVTP
ncbi:MAG: PadR family transcriptional regulator [Pseudomonadota bacterium]